MIIGLSQRVLVYREREYDSLSRDFYKYFEGHTLLPIPNGYNIDYDELASKLDMLVLTGGDASEDRVVTELNIASKMTKLGKPVLGICHGAFLLTEVLEGTIESDGAEWNTTHPVFYNGEARLVNSYHTDIISNAPPNATTLCTDEHNNVEAWIKGNTAAIVWHPERMAVPWIPKEISLLFIKQLPCDAH